MEMFDYWTKAFGKLSDSQSVIKLIGRSNLEDEKKRKMIDVEMIIDRLDLRRHAEEWSDQRSDEWYEEYTTANEKFNEEWECDCHLHSYIDAHEDDCDYEFELSDYVNEAMEEYGCVEDYTDVEMILLDTDHCLRDTVIDARSVFEVWKKLPLDLRIESLDAMVPFMEEGESLEGFSIFDNSNLIEVYHYGEISYSQPPTKDWNV